MGRLHFVAQSAFDDLLAQWRSHSALKTTVLGNPMPHNPMPNNPMPNPVHEVPCNVSLKALATSRHRLDVARHRMHQLRAAMYPTSDELEEVLLTVLCTHLDEIVHLNWTRRDRHDSNVLWCVCGESISILPDSSYPKPVDKG